MRRRLGKRERQRRIAASQAVMPRLPVSRNLANPMPEASLFEAVASHLRTRNGLPPPARFMDPVGNLYKGGTISTKAAPARFSEPAQGTSAKQVTGSVGYRLTKRNHKEVLTRFSWEGQYRG